MTVSSFHLISCHLCTETWEFCAKPLLNRQESSLVLHNISKCFEDLAAFAALTRQVALRCKHSKQAVNRYSKQQLWAFSHRPCFPTPRRQQVPHLSRHQQEAAANGV